MAGAPFHKARRLLPIGSELIYAMSDPNARVRMADGDRLTLRQAREQGRLPEFAAQVEQKRAEALLGDRWTK